MTNRMLVFIVIFSLSLIGISLYIISYLDPGEKPKPTSVITNLKDLNIKVSNNFKLTFTNGQDFTFQNLQDKYSLIYFGFSYCPDVCPVTLDTIKEALSLLKPSELEKVQAIFVSVDPERDSLQELQKFIAQFPNIQAVTGEEEEIKKLTTSLKAYYMKTGDKDNAGDDYYVDHSSFIYFLNPKVELISQFSSEIKPEDIVKQIRKKLK